MGAPLGRPAQGLPLARLAGGARRQRPRGLPLDALLRLRGVHRLRRSSTPSPRRCRRRVAARAPARTSPAAVWSRCRSSSVANRVDCGRWARDARPGPLRQARQGPLHGSPRRRPACGSGRCARRACGSPTARASRRGPGSASAWRCRPAPSRSPSTSTSSSPIRPDGSTLPDSSPTDSTLRCRRVSPCSPRSSWPRASPRCKRTSSRVRGSSSPRPRADDVAAGVAAALAADRSRCHPGAQGRARLDDVRPGIESLVVVRATAPRATDHRGRSGHPPAGMRPSELLAVCFPAAAAARRIARRTRAAHTSMDRTRRRAAGAPPARRRRRVAHHPVGARMRKELRGGELHTGTRRGAPNATPAAHPARALRRRRPSARRPTPTARTGGRRPGRRIGAHGDWQRRRPEEASPRLAWRAWSS